MAIARLSVLTGQIFSETFSYGIGGAVAPALSPLTQEVLNRVWPTRPIVPLTPEELATMAVQGVIEESEGAQEALMSGIDAERFHKLYRVNGNPPGPQELLDLWDRGAISESDVDRGLLQSRLKPEWVSDYKKLQRRLLQAEALAEMVVQGVLPEEEATKKARQVSIEPEDFGRLVRLAGNPFGPETTLSLLNRDILTEQEARRALLQSRLKPEWIDQFLESRYRPASTAQAVEAVVRERITHDAGAEIAAKNGINRETFDLLVETGGRPIGIVQALTLFNRGVYKRNDVEEVVARSNVRPEYTDAILHLAVRYPSLFQVRQLVQHGAVTDEYAIRLLTEQGYPHDLAVGVVEAGHNEKNKADRDLTKSEFVTLYSEGAIAREDAAAGLGLLGYDEREAEFLLEIADFRRIAKYLEAVISKVHSQYVNHRIDVDVVTTTLDRIAVPTTQREALLDLWNEERAANVKVLTPAQIVRAVRRNVIDRAVGIAKLIQQGYGEEDATILLSI